LYGVIAYAVSQRTHELGVRLALGATSQRIAGMVVGQGLALTLGGVVVGIVAALLVTRVLGSLLFGVSTLDPPTFGVVLTLLLVVAAVASYVPARRAARVDPLVAMRGE
jgi:putative ABC transport system permease protein